MSKTIIAVAPKSGQIEVIVDRLQNQGAVSNADISVFTPDSRKTWGEETSTREKTRDAPAMGITSDTLGALAGTDNLMAPNVGPYMVAGPNMGALAALTTTGSDRDLKGALSAMGLSEEDIKDFKHKVGEGNFLVSIHHVDAKHEEDVCAILRQEGAGSIRSFDSTPKDNI